MPPETFERTTSVAERSVADSASFTTLERELGALAKRVLKWSVRPSHRSGAGVVRPPVPGAAKARALTPSRRPAAPFRTSPREPQPARVLVVDDDVDAMNSLGDLLRLFGLEVHLAHAAEDALAAARRVLPHAILCDLEMPSLDGFDVARCVRADPLVRDAALLAVSGHHDERTRRRALEAGFDAHLSKPVEVETLKAALARLLVEPHD
jgi:CheY-like chemotaxis protein